MSTNKHATIRYNALDRCFRNPGRRYYIDDLVDECNNAINDFDPESFGVQKRQVYDDIRFMISDAGFKAPIERVKDGNKKKFLRYVEGSNFSISNQPLNESEVNQLQQAILTLNRFKGLPQFSWIEELSMRLESDFKIQSSMQVIEFEQNPYLKGLEHFDDIFNAIVYKKVVKVEYKGYKHDVTQIMELSPSYLKQYNNRWYLLAYNHKYKALSHLALDRIIDIKEVKIKYLESEIDFTEYFDDVVGVTIDKESEPIRIVLKFSKKQWKYINSKPLHASQKVIGIAIEPKTQKDLERLEVALGKLSEEDPTFTVKTDEDSGQKIISGTVKTDEDSGQTIILGKNELLFTIGQEHYKKLKREFDVECNQVAPQVAYKESTIISLEVQINFELERLIFSFGSNVEVISPPSLITTMLDRANEVVDVYS